MKNRLQLLALVLVVLFQLAIAKGEEKKNILWIYVEDLSPWLSAYGHDVNKGKTPAIDAMMNDGVMFSRCYMPAPVCSACRSALITGVYQTTTGTHQHRSSFTPESAIQLPDGVQALPELFIKHGYATFNKGKDDYNFIYERENLYSVGVNHKGKGKEKGKEKSGGKVSGGGDWRDVPEGKG